MRCALGPGEVKEQRSPPVNIRLLTLCAAAIGLAGSQLAFAQQQPLQAPTLMSIVGAPFSGVRTWQGARNFADGNRIDNGSAVRLYRDGQGRTRVERELPPRILANNPQMDPVQIAINDPVSGDHIELRAKTKTAVIVRGGATPALPRPKAPFGVFVTFAGRGYAASDPGWSKPIPLGEKSFDGVPASGQRWKYTIGVGAIGNEKPVVLTVEQWFSPDLSLVIAKSGTSSLGGEFSNQIENIVRGEPDPSLFLIPSDYRRIEAPPQQGTIR
jgi:hypothetical protein